MKFGLIIINTKMYNIFKKGNVFSLLILALYICVSVAFMVFIPNLFSFLNIHSSIVLLFFFLMLNISLAFFFKLIPTLKEHWSVLKLHHFFLGFFSWLLILSIAYCIKLYLGGYDLIFEKDKASIWMGLGLTIIIVAWEELMFRGVILNFLQKFSSKIYLSFISGLLFMLIHLLNPEINILVQGLNLFFAGFLLSILYLKFKNIWLPLGFHFANNVFNSRIELVTGYKLDMSDVFLSNEGYLDTFFLALTCFIVYRIKVN